MGEERSVAERYFWLWIALAFVVGLVPGVIGLVWYRTTTSAYSARLVERRNALTAENTKLTADNTKLESDVASAQAAAAAASPGQFSTGSDTTSAGPVPKPKPGQIAFVSRTVSPSTAAPGATIALSTVIAGKATDAYMQVKSETGTVSKIWKLHRGSLDGDAQTWIRSDAIAPKAAGSYVVFSWAFVGPKKFVMPGAGLLTVK
jgi:hypothetical protein